MARLSWAQGAKLPVSFVSLVCRDTGRQARRKGQDHRAGREGSATCLEY